MSESVEVSGPLFVRCLACRVPTVFTAVTTDLWLLRVLWGVGCRLHGLPFLLRARSSLTSPSIEANCLSVGCVAVLLPAGTSFATFG